MGRNDGYCAVAKYERCISNVVFGDKQVLGDKGYQGIAKLHTNRETPKKQPKGGTVTEAEQEENRRIGRERMLIEHMNAKIKVFKITSSKYRNRRITNDLNLWHY